MTTPSHRRFLADVSFASQSRDLVIERRGPGQLFESEAGEMLAQIRVPERQSLDVEVGQTAMVDLRIAKLMAEHTLSEYRALEALVQEAPGVPADLLDAVTPLYDESAREMKELEGPREP